MLRLCSVHLLRYGCVMVGTVRVVAVIFMSLGVRFVILVGIYSISAYCVIHILFMLCRRKRSKSLSFRVTSAV